MAVSKRLRHEILRRDRFACRYCGATAPDVKLTVDHVIPVALGGDDSPSNLVAACVDCNAGKSSAPIDAPVVEDVGRSAQAWAAARQEVIEEMRGERNEFQEFENTFLRYWGLFRCGERTISMDSKWRTTLRAWAKRGLDIHDLLPLVDIAMARENIAIDERWRYFCGVVWRTLDDIEERTARIVQETPSEPAPAPPPERVWIATALHVYPHPSSRYAEPYDEEEEMYRGCNDRYVWS